MPFGSRDQPNEVHLAAIRETGEMIATSSGVSYESGHDLVEAAMKGDEAAESHIAVPRDLVTHWGHGFDREGLIVSLKCIFSSELNETATLDDLNYEYMKEYLVRTNAAADVRTLSKLDMAKALHLIDSSEYGGYRAKNFAVPLFADRPDEFIPYAYVEVIREALAQTRWSQNPSEGRCGYRHSVCGSISGILSWQHTLSENPENLVHTGCSIGLLKCLRSWRPTAFCIRSIPESSTLGFMFTEIICHLSITIDLFRL